MAHIATLADAKDLLRAGVDGFGHCVRDRDVDAELVAMLKARPNVFFVETMWGERNAIYAGPPPWLAEPIVRDTMSAAEIQQLRDGFLPAAGRPAAGDRGCRSSPAQRGGAAQGWREARSRHRHRRRHRRRRIRSGVPRGARADGQGRPDADAGNRRGHAHVSGHPRTRSARHDRAGQIGRLPRARREPARRHRQHAPDFDGLPAGCRSQRAPTKKSND